MSDPKNDLINSIRVPGSEVNYLAEWFQRIVPEMPDLRAATTTDDAVKGIYDYCVNCNKILQLLPGIPLLDFMLRAGQRNDNLIGMLLSGLEYIGAKTDEIVLISPKDKGLYFGYVRIYSCTVSGSPVSVEATVDGENFAMSGAGGTYSAEWATAIGSHTLSITADFGSGSTKTISATFDIKSWDDAVSIPEPDQRLGAVQTVQIQTGTTDNISDITFSGGQGGETGGSGASGSWNAVLKKDNERWIADDVATSGLNAIPPGDYAGTFTITTPDGSATKIVPFTVTGQP